MKLILLILPAIVITTIAFVLYYLFTGVTYLPTLMECDKWHEQGTTMAGLELVGYSRSDALKYQNELAKEFDFKIEKCEWTDIEGAEVYWCRFCEDWRWKWKSREQECPEHIPAEDIVWYCNAMEHPFLYRVRCELSSYIIGEYQGTPYKCLPEDMIEAKKIYIVTVCSSETSYDNALDICVKGLPEEYKDKINIVKDFTPKSLLQIEEGLGD